MPDEPFLWAGVLLDVCLLFYASALSVLISIAGVNIKGRGIFLPKEGALNTLPWLKFYPDDWITGTRAMNPEEKAAWIDLLCFMWMSDTRGSVTGTWEGLARMLGLPWSDCERIILGMSRQNHLTVTERNGDVTLTSRRMQREENGRESTKIRASRYRERVRHASVTLQTQKPEAIKDKDTTLSPAENADDVSGEVLEASKSELYVLTATGSRISKVDLTPGGSHIVPFRPQNVQPAPSGAAVAVSQKLVATAPKPDQPDPTDLAGLWNELAHPNLPRVRILPDKRKNHVRARMKEYPHEEFWRGLFARINRSPLLTGQRGDWKCDFDWVMNPNNLTKIIEGNYDKR